MIIKSGLMILGLLTAALGVATCEKLPILQLNFETDESGWLAMGQSSKVSLTHEASNVKEGKAALKFDYGVKKNEFNLMVLPTPEEKIGKMQSLSFWVKPTHSTSLILVLSEKEGGHYNAMFSVSKNRWQHVELAPEDFTLGTGKDDPKDPDGKLDLEKVEGIGIADFGQILAQNDDPNLAKLLHIQNGDQILFLDDFTVSETKIAVSSSVDQSGYHFDSFVRPQLAWLTFGEANLTRMTDKPLTGSSLQADYHQSAGTLAGIARAVNGKNLAGKTQLHFDAASSKPTTIRIQLEESGGGKYFINIDLPGSSEKKAITVNFADFNAADDSKDNNSKLDLDQVTQIMFIDFSGLAGAVDQDNSFWLNNLRASNKE